MRNRNIVRAELIPTDALVTHGGMSWYSDKTIPSKLKCYDGSNINLSEVDVLWWRRFSSEQSVLNDWEDKSARSIVNNEWKAALGGFIHDTFNGIFVNNPLHDTLAGNKLYQLTAAQRMGFRIPDTYIGQSPEQIRKFCKKHGGQIVVKKLIGSSEKALVSLLLDESQLNDDEAIALCPSIYQEPIRSSRHLRVNCFGNRVRTLLIESNVFDWRRDYTVPFKPYELDKTICDRLMALLDDLGLKMGIFDMILPENGEPVWLELNTQGQFLFGEALGKVDLVNPFCDFLLDVMKECPPASRRSKQQQKGRH